MDLNTSQPVRGQLLDGETLALHVVSAWRAGGDVLFLPADADDLATFLKALLESVRVLPIGIGSNVIFATAASTAW